MPDCVLANRTDLDRAVDRVLLVFGSLSGFALVKFATTTTEFDGHEFNLWVVWPLAVALAAFLLRFILGSAIHLNQRFVKDITADGVTPQIITLFVKDLAFIIAFGLIAVGLTECRHIDTFIFWSTVMVSLGVIWGLVDGLARWLLSEPNWTSLEVLWLIIDILQTIVFFWFYKVFQPEHDYKKAAWFAAVSILFLMIDIVVLLDPRVKQTKVKELLSNIVGALWGRRNRT